MSERRDTTTLERPSAVFSDDRPLVCVQGLGFVGTAMALAIASARDPAGGPLYNVAAVDLDNEEGRRKVSALNAGTLPFAATDPKIEAALLRASEERNLHATADPSFYAEAQVVVVDVGLDLQRRDGRPFVDFEPLRASVRLLGSRMRPGSLVVIETTVPPGTCEKVLGPELDRGLEERGLQPGAVLLAHSYERVMPGAQYLDSIVNFWRVYAGRSDEAAEACERFLASVVNVDDYPLTRLPSTTASEIAKLLENSYRATTIALMEEWGRLAEAVDVDLYEVIAAIRKRPTHSNMRQPGFGVGGYCLTKDPLFAEYGAREVLERRGLEFPFSTGAVEANDVMPLVSLDKLQELLGGTLQGRRVLLLGLSYRQDVGDTRFSPSRLFADEARDRGAQLVCHDPLVDSWEGHELVASLPAPEGFDAVVFAVGHEEYAALDLAAWLGGARPLLLDANSVLSKEQLAALSGAGCRVWSIGRGWVSS